jgi:choline dehydrogenase-like flavoprotein
MLSPCIRCNTCDGYPCLVDAKSDSDVCAVRPVMKRPNVTLITEAKVVKLNAKGRDVTSVAVERHGERMQFAGDVVVVACGAINSAALLLKSEIANSSGMVGRNFMKHQNGGIVAVSTRANPTAFQKTLMFNDFYWGEEAFPWPMGHVSLTGKMNKEKLALGAPALAPGFTLDLVAQRSVDWWITSEDLPDPNNRVRLDSDGETIVLEYDDNNTEAYERLVSRWISVLESVDPGLHILPTGIYLRKKVPLSGVAHQCGTVKMGTDPKTSVLDPSCKAHDLDNLYVVDASLFPSSAAVNPSLTIMANALRVGDLLAERLR